MAILVDANAMLDRTRYLIDEESQRSFSNEDLLQSINIGALAVQAEIVKLDVGYFEKPADLNPSATPPGTSAGVELYSLPSDFLKFKLVTRTDTGLVLGPTMVQHKTRQRPSLTPISGPLNYYVSGNNIGFDPVPQASIPIEMLYIYRIPTLVNGTDVSELPEDWRDMACIKAAIDAKEKDEADSSALERMWNRDLERLRSTVSNRQVQEPMRVIRSNRSW